MKKLLTAALTTVIIATSAPTIADAADRFLISNEVQVFRQGNAFELIGINKAINDSVYKIKGTAYADGVVSVSYTDEQYNPLELLETTKLAVEENGAFNLLIDIPEETESKVLYAFVTLTLENGVEDTIMIEVE